MSNRLDLVLEQMTKDYQILEDNFCNFVADFIVSQKLKEDRISFSITPDYRQEWMMLVFELLNTQDTSKANFVTTLSFNAVCEILKKKGAKIEVVDSGCKVEFLFYKQ